MFPSYYAIMFPSYYAVMFPSYYAVIERFLSCNIMEREYSPIRVGLHVAMCGV